ncbi:sensor histidine kinase [Cellulomonas endophytica]|uniref:sensor histidine kinase n=1 Tax=Cellulomonas endophytica TaxID=2494735 RepID=UPI00101048EF|nr:ATP-binding protein [Cellulomonas endophytica]
MTSPRATADGRLARTGRRRALVASVAAVVGLAVLTAVLVAARPAPSLPVVVLLYLVPVVLAAAAGGTVPAAASGVAAAVLVNYFFVEPLHTLEIGSRQDVVTLAVYVGVAVVVGLAVDAAARSRTTAARRAVEAALLARASTGPVEEGSLPRLLGQVAEAYRMSTVALLEDGAERERVGPPPAGTPTHVVAAGGGVELHGWGPRLFAEDRGALERLAAAAARALETQRLAAGAARAERLARVDELRAALLGAVGHDLRTPLAGIKAAVSGLRQRDVVLSEQDRDELLATVEESADRLTGVVDNLLSLSRLRAGALAVDLAPTPLDAVVAAAVLGTDTGGVAVLVDVPDDLPPARADAGLLERVVANLVSNACRASPPTSPVRVEGASADGRVLLRVVDHGPGVPPERREAMFVAFQRLDDTTGDGLGLGLAVARGFTEAQGGTLVVGDTPGGGLTLTVELPVAA